MSQERNDDIRERILAIQEASARATSQFRGEELSIVDQLKGLRRAIGVESDEEAKSASFIGNIADMLELFGQRYFKTPEQYAAEEAAAAAAAAEADDAFYRQYLYDMDIDNLSGYTEEDMARAAEIKAALTSK